MRRAARADIALDRISQAIGWKITRAGKSFVVHVPGADEPCPPKPAIRALAFVADSARYDDSFAEVRDEVRWAPQSLPQRGLSHWELRALEALRL